MKSQAKVTEVLFLIGIVILLISLLLIFPKLWKDMLASIAYTSPKVVVRDIAGLITISGAAPHTIEIYYTVPTEKNSYNLEIAKRDVYVQMLNEDKKLIGEKEKASIPIDPTTKLFDKVEFLITKTIKNSQKLYEVKS